VSFWDVVWFIIISFAFIAYLIVLFQIVGDLFRDSETSGVVKAVWLIALVFLPFLTALVYLIARGRGMAERQAASVMEMKAQQDAYIRDVAGQGSSPADEIARAAQMRDRGEITEAEYHKIKEKALA
jgi:hypothetical protein